MAIWENTKNTYVGAQAIEVDYFIKSTIPILKKKKDYD